MDQPHGNTATRHQPPDHAPTHPLISHTRHHPTPHAPRPPAPSCAARPTTAPHPPLSHARRQRAPPRSGHPKPLPTAFSSATLRRPQIRRYSRRRGSTRVGKGTRTGTRTGTRCAHRPQRHRHPAPPPNPQYHPIPSKYHAEHHAISTQIALNHPANSEGVLRSRCERLRRRCEDSTELSQIEWNWHSRVTRLVSLGKKGKM